MARRSFSGLIVSTVATGRRRLAEHLIARGMVKPEMLSSVSKVRSAPKGTAANAGWREIGGRRIYARSSWESNTAKWLNFLCETGALKSWAHEAKTYWFAGIKRGVVSYLPDFEIVELTGTLKVVETKGHLDARSITKLKRMKKYHPNVPIVLVGKASHQALADKIGAEFVSYRGLVRTVGPLIRGWE